MSGFYCKALIGKILVLWIGDHLWEVVANGDSTVYLYILCGLKISLSTIVSLLREQIISNFDTGNSGSLNILLCPCLKKVISFSRFCPLKLLALSYVAVVKKNLNVVCSQLN